MLPLFLWLICWNMMSYVYNTPWNYLFLYFFWKYWGQKKYPNRTLSFHNQLVIVVYFLHSFELIIIFLKSRSINSGFKVRATARIYRSRNYVRICFSNDPFFLKLNWIGSFCKYLLQIWKCLTVYHNETAWTTVVTVLWPYWKYFLIEYCYSMLINKHFTNATTRQFNVVLLWIISKPIIHKLNNS